MLQDGNISLCVYAAGGRRAAKSGAAARGGRRPTKPLKAAAGTILSGLKGKPLEKNDNKKRNKNL